MKTLSARIAPKLLPLLLAFAWIPAAELAAQHPIYEAETFVEIREAFLAADFGRLKTLVRADLSRPSPHANTYLVAQKIVRDIDPGFADELSRPQREMVAFVDRALRLHEQNRDLDLFELYEQCPQPQHLPPALFYVFAAAAYTMDFQLGSGIVERGLAVHGDHFRAAWNMAFGGGFGQRFRYGQQFTADPAMKGYPATLDYLRQLQAYPPDLGLTGWPAHVRLLAVRAYLKRQPRDAAAHRRSAQQLAALNRTQEALEAYLHSYQLDPFYSDGRSLRDAIALYFKLDQVEAGEATLKDYLARHFPRADQDRLYARWAAELFDQGLHKEAARHWLQKGLTAYPGETAFPRLGAQMAYDKDQYQKALAFFRQMPREDLREDPTRYNRFLYSLDQEEDYGALLEEWAWFQDHQEAGNVNVFSRFYYLFKRIEEPQRALRVLDQGLEIYPHAAWLLTTRGNEWLQAGKLERAEDLLERALAISPTPYRVNRWVETQVQAGKTRKASLQELHETYPYSYAVLDQRAGAADDPWEFLWAQEDLPHSFTRERNLWVMAKSKDQRARYVSFSQERLEQSDRLDDSLFYLYTLMYEYESLSFGGYLSAAQIEDALRACEQYRRLGGDLARYYQTRAYLLRLQGQAEEARAAIESAISANPYKAITIRSARMDFGSVKSLLNYRELLEKDFQHYDNLGWYMWMNALYGGSMLNAVWAYDTCQALFPGQDCRFSIYVKALDALGDPTQNLERYQSQTNLGTSHRYLNWYDASRKKSWAAADQVEWDKDRNRIVVLHANGEESVQMDDPRTGKPTLRQRGNLWVRYAYTETGDLREINTSAGLRIQMIYDDMGKISRMISSEQGQLDYTYNDQGKPIRIDVKGLGSVTVTYTPSGEIEQVDAEKGGHSVALRITSMMEDLLAYAQSFDLDDVPLPDPEHDQLQQTYAERQYALDWEGEKLSLDLLRAAQAYVQYLKGNLATDSDYASEALEVCQTMLQHLPGTESLELKTELVVFAGYFHDVLLDIRRHGVAMDYWEDWVEVQDLLEREKLDQQTLNPYRQRIEDLQRTFQDQPIELLASAEWLPKSSWSNPAYWSSTSLAEIIPGYDFADLPINHFARRPNGDLLLATDRGIALRKGGYWRFLYHDALRQKLVANRERVKVLSKTTFHHIADLDDQGLLLSSSTGLYHLDPKDLSLRKLSPGGPGYIGDRPVKLYAHYPYVLLYDEASVNLLKLEGESARLLQTLASPGGEIRKLLPLGQWEGEQGMESTQLLLTSQGMFQTFLHEAGVNPGPVQVSDMPYVDDALLEEDGEGYALYLLQGNVLYRQALRLDPEQDMPVLSPEAPPLPVYGNLVMNQRALGLAWIPVDDDEFPLGVLTDMGINIYKDRHFEFWRLPGQDGLDQLGPQTVAASGAFGILSRQQFLEFDREPYHYLEQKPDKIRRLPGQEVTLRLMEGTLYFSTGSQVFEWEIVTDGFGTAIEDFHIGHDQAVYLLDYQTVYRAQFDSLQQDFAVEALFSIDPTKSDEAYDLEAKDRILLARDGTVWVKQGASVFRYDPDRAEPLREFSFLRDRDRFPAATLDVFNLVETYEGEIWVACPDENWNDYKGTALSGGLLRYDPGQDRFDYLDPDDPTPDFPWFLTAYTRLGPEEGLLATEGGFAFHGPGGVRHVRETNSSYAAIERKHKNLFLGTEGVRFGDLLLFGCAEGVLAYHEGTWFFPDRLNQLLPEHPAFGQRGGNKVNTLAVDHLGRLNIATDLGLLIIEADRLAPFDLLMMSTDVEKSIEWFNLDKLRREKETLFHQLAGELEPGSPVRRALDLDRERAELERLRASFQDGFMARQSAFKTLSVDSIDAQVRRIDEAYADLLLSLKEKNPVLFQALRLPPLDLAGLRQNLREDECVVQYIPLKRKLIIQLITRSKLQLKEVDVSRAELDELSILLAARLNPRRDVRGVTPVNVDTSSMRNVTHDLLEQLYNHLLRPIDADLQPFRENVQIIAEGALNYVPFEALIDRGAEGEPHYAVERFAFSYLSSLYMLQLLNERPEAGGRQALLVGDPDETLPGAKAEVEHIARLMTDRPDVLLGAEAGIEVFKGRVQDKDIVHLATHGFVDKQDIKGSWLQFADRKMRLSEVYGLNMDPTELLVLSACETGLGKEGLETTTLARAFANAGIEHLLATLWQVDDEATQLLMTRFYQAMLQGTGYRQALQEAKLHLIRDQVARGYAEPQYWAGFILIGKS